MGTIRVAWGSAAGPTAMSSFDAALAEANCHNYNLVTLSSVVPAGADIEVVGTLPDLGPVGESLPVVSSRATVPPGADEPAVAGLGWIRSESGRGLFYEASGADPDAVRRAIRTGIERGTGLREWAFATEPEVVIEAAEPANDDYVTATALAAYGQSSSLFE